MAEASGVGVINPASEQTRTSAKAAGRPSPTDENDSDVRTFLFGTRFSLCPMFSSPYLTTTSTREVHRR